MLKVYLYILQELFLIKIGNDVVKSMQVQLTSCILKSDTNTIESKHSGKYIAHFFYDVSQVSQLVGSGILNLDERLLNLNCFSYLNVLSKLETCFICNNYDAIGCFCCKIFREKNR